MALLTSPGRKSPGRLTGRRRGGHGTGRPGTPPRSRGTFCAKFEEDVEKKSSRSTLKEKRPGGRTAIRLEILHMKFGDLGGNLELHNGKLHKL